MQRLLGLSVAYLALSGCVAPSPPEEQPPAAPFVEAAPPSPETDVPPQSAEQVNPSPIEFDRSEVLTYAWACGPEGTEFVEAAFRFQFADNPLNPDAVETADFIFLGINTPEGVVDPPDALISRFKDLPKVEELKKPQ